MVRIDLGCGAIKESGFIGVDRYPLPGVDVIANLDEPLPFHTDTADFIFASHSLEHVKNLLTTMKEIYRVCKHGAQLCVLAPYSEQKLNLANPYHTWQFNEHTPRFWTSYPRAPIDPEELNNQFPDQWGLSRTDNSDPGIDIRLARMEHFYYPRYVPLPIPEQRRLRQERMDVCDQILYHLIIWKGDEQSPAKPFDDYVNEIQPYEPRYVAILKQRTSEALLAKQFTEPQELARVSKICADQTEVIRQMTTELKDAAACNRTLRDEAARAERELEFARADLRRESTRLTESQAEAASLRENLHALQINAESQAVLTAKLAVTQAELETTAALLVLNRQKEELLNAEVAAATKEANNFSQLAERWRALYAAARLSVGGLYNEIRSSRPALVRAAGFVIGRQSRSGQLRDAFVPLRSYCDQHFGSGRASVVLESDLTEVPYREYEIPFDLDCLKSVFLAVRPLLSGSGGSAGIEIVSSESEILVQSVLPLDAIQPDEITEFRLPAPLTGLKRTWLLRVFVRGADAPVPVYELAQGTLFRGVTQFFPFVLFT